MKTNFLENFSNTNIPGWNGLLVLLMILTGAICLAKKYQSMTKLLTLQATVLSLMTFVLGYYLKEGHLFFAGIANFLIKGMAIPYLLADALKKSRLYTKKDEHFSVMQAVLWMGAITIIASQVTPSVLELAGKVPTRTIQMGIAGVFLGIWLMVFRNYLYSQVVGLLLMENSLYLLALALTHGLPLMVEMGILFDVFICVVVMGVLLHKVRGLFDSTEIEQLKQLKG